MQKSDIIFSIDEVNLSDGSGTKTFIYLNTKENWDDGAGDSYWEACNDEENEDFIHNVMEELHIAGFGEICEISEREPTPEDMPIPEIKQKLENIGITYDSSYDEYMHDLMKDEVWRVDGDL